MVRGRASRGPILKPYNGSDLKALEQWAVEFAAQSWESREEILAALKNLKSSENLQPDAIFFIVLAAVRINLGGDEPLITSNLIGALVVTSTAAFESVRPPSAWRLAESALSAIELLTASYPNFASKSSTIIIGLSVEPLFAQIIAIAKRRYLIDTANPGFSTVRDEVSKWLSFSRGNYSTIRRFTPRD